MVSHTQVLIPHTGTMSLAMAFLVVVVFFQTINETIFRETLGHGRRYFVDFVDVFFERYRLWR